MELVLPIITAAISAASALLVCSMQTRSAERRQETERAENFQLLAYKLDQLQERVDKHNNLVERMFKAEEDIALLKQENEQRQT